MADTAQVDRYEPSYKRGCAVCGMKPVVTGITNGRVVYDGGLCGPCLWGESEMADETLWNDDEAQS